MIKFLKVAILFALLAAAECKTKKAKKKVTFAPQKSNINSIQEFLNVTSSVDFAVVYFQNASSPAKPLESAFFKNTASRLRRPISFVFFNCTDIPHDDLRALGVKVLPSVYLSVNGHLKHYTGAPAAETLKIWIAETLAARPVAKKSHTDVDHIDKHYFVFVSRKLLKIHQKYVNILAKLISPLRIYTGFNRTELKEMLHEPDLHDSAFVHREYGHQQQKIDFSLPLGELAHRITSQEFPSSVVCNDHSFRFITEFKIPALFYFSHGGDDKVWDLVKKAAADYSDYMMPVRVDAGKNDKCNLFARNFLQVKKAPALRILNLSKGVKRFKFFGELDEEHISYFLLNYISGNLKNYRLNQRLQRGQTIKGVPQGNFKMFKKAVDDYNHRYLVYVYDPFVSDLNSDLAVLKSVAAKLSPNKSFKIMAIDHYHNDIDGFHSMNLPMTFLILRKGKFALYEKGKLTRAGLLEHIKKHLPNLELVSDLETDL